MKTILILGSFAAGIAMYRMVQSVLRTRRTQRVLRQQWETMASKIQTRL
jgi:hypothetical protein